MNGLVTKLASIDRYVDAAAIVCDATRPLVHQCTVMLHRTGGPVTLAVDNISDLTDEHRLWGVTRANWDSNPMFQRLRARLGPIGGESLDHHVFVAPVIGPTGWFATISFGALTPCSLELERDLAMVATQFSVWCTAHGIDLGEQPTPCLAPGQHRIARLAASGLTNREIAYTLGISVNTVKLRLKQIFERLGVDNRTELARLELAPLDDTPDGITRLPTVTITRATREPSRRRLRSR